MRKILRPDTGAGIRNLYHQPLLFRNNTDGYEASFRCMPDGIFNEILEYAFNKRDISRNKGQIFHKVCSEPDLFLLGSELELLHYVLDELGQRERFKADLDVWRIKFGQFKECGNQLS